MAVSLSTRNVIRLHIGRLFETSVWLNDVAVLGATAVAHGCDKGGEYVAFTLVKGESEIVEAPGGAAMSMPKSARPTLVSGWHTVRIGEQHVAVRTEHLRERYDEAFVVIDCRMYVGPLLQLVFG